MGLMEDLKVETKVMLCPIGRLLLILSDEESALVKNCVDDEGYPLRGIEVALRKAGHPISLNSITGHRKKRCVCVVSK